MAERDPCTCDVREPRRDHAVARSISGYAIYLDFVEDETRFDPACPYHGDDGTMVAVAERVDPVAWRYRDKRQPAYGWRLTTEGPYAAGLRNSRDFEVEPLFLAAPPAGLTREEMEAVVEALGEWEADGFTTSHNERWHRVLSGRDKLRAALRGPA